MFKLKSLILLVVVLVTATHGQQNNSNATQGINNFVNMNRQQYALNIENYDAELDLFKQNYAASLDTTDIQMNLLIGSLRQAENKLKSLEVLNKICVNKYRSLLPTINGIKSNMTSCKTTYSNKLSNLLINPTNTRNSLQNYYKNSFERNVDNCKRSYSTSPSNYTTCVKKVVSDTDEYTNNNQKTFSNQMDAVQCSGNSHIRQALDCSFSTETYTISAIAETITLVNKCMDGEDECKSCNEQFYSCTLVSYMYRSQISYENQFMNNPFYRRYDATDCLMLQIQ